MQSLNIIILLLSAIILLCTTPVDVYGGGPGFDRDVNNWSNRRDDDDRYNRDDDDRYNRDDDRHNDDNDDNNDIPLDGGLSFLAIAGLAFGVKKARDTVAKNK